MTVFPSAPPRCRNFTSSLLPSPNICCARRKFNIWNQLNMQNPEQEHLMPTGIVKCVKTTWSHGGQLHSDMTIWVAQRTENKKSWFPYLIEAASSKATGSISIVKILTINITAHTNTPLTFSYKNIMRVFLHVCGSGAKVKHSICSHIRMQTPRDQ